MRALRNLHGVFPVYKPRNVTSAECCNIIKMNLIKDLNDPHLMESNLKVGHGGTLDKEATGVLTVGLGSGCKKLTEFIHGPKAYVCQSIMGFETDTGYLSGNEVGKMHYDHVTENSLQEVLKHFLGSILQAPPIFSALKYKGRRLSDIAYAGEEIPEEKLRPRRVEIFKINCIQFDPPHFTLEISCGPGCYVRSLVRDISHALSTCAYVAKLERTKHGNFCKEDCIWQNDWRYDDILLSLRTSRSGL